MFTTPMYGLEFQSIFHRFFGLLVMEAFHTSPPWLFWVVIVAFLTISLPHIDSVLNTLEATPAHHRP